MSKITAFGQHPTTSGMLTCYVAPLDCGHDHYSEGWKPFPVEVTVGSQVECSACAEEKRSAEWVEALDAATVHHARFDPRFGGRYLFYRLDQSSPSGFMLIGAAKATKAVDAIIDRKHLCALSPTER